jgi:trehalose 6-phosphate synthase
MSLVPVELSEEEVDRYYEGMSNASLWPLYHDVVEKPEYHRKWWDAYVQVNKRFADRAIEVAAEGAVVWVHDYQLQLVPAMLRQRRPDLTIGFFLHIPFPPYELFTQLPWRSAIVEGLLGADLVGFQRPSAAANFVQLARRLHELPTRANTIEYDGRVVTAKAFPISIDVKSFDELARSPEVLARAAEIHKELGEPEKVVLGVDRHRPRAGGHPQPRARGALRAHARDHRAAGRPHQRRPRLHRRPRRALLQPVHAA